MNEVNRPMASTMRTDAPEYHHRGGSKLPWVVLAVVVIVLVVFGVLFRDKWMGKGGAMTKSGDYQAVFLTNGQVYFGKMSEGGKGYLKLNDIFYLQVNQPQIQGSQETQQQAQAQPQLQLVKLGNELHGPEDEMYINRDQVLFYEDMKADAKVVEAIKEYKANPNAGQQQQQGQQQAPAATPTPVAPTATPAK